MSSERGSAVNVVRRTLFRMLQPLQNTYRDEIYSLQLLLSRTQAGPGRTVKQEQEEISPNHVQRINLIFVCNSNFVQTAVM